MHQTFRTRLKNKWHFAMYKIGWHRMYAYCKCKQYFVTRGGETLEIAGTSHSKKSCFACDSYGAPLKGTSNA